ncbi:hypothetical protein ZOSMA_50G00940 [Zostera marina]|uniref:Uncharacterized protein n=1 Tax=Zostera marina TaxID=29655 RepID=A0A0K9P0D1_ZOSMR|nr:hypothetical protein ZOSMA_50G00940 [Zostera marina]
MTLSIGHDFLYLFNPKRLNLCWRLEIIHFCLFAPLFLLGGPSFILTGATFFVCGIIWVVPSQTDLIFVVV